MNNNECECYCESICVTVSLKLWNNLVAYFVFINVNKHFNKYFKTYFFYSNALQRLAMVSNYSIFNTCRAGKKRKYYISRAHKMWKFGSQSSNTQKQLHIKFHFHNRPLCREYRPEMVNFWHACHLEHAKQFFGYITDHKICPVELIFKDSLKQITPVSIN